MMRERMCAGLGAVLIVASSSATWAKKPVETDPLLRAASADFDMRSKLLDDRTALIRAWGSGARSPTLLRDVLLYRAALLAKTAGYDRMAVVKQGESRMVQMGSTLLTSAAITVVFVRPGDAPAPLGAAPVVYVAVADALRELSNDYSVDAQPQP